MGRRWGEVVLMPVRRLNPEGAVERRLAEIGARLTSAATVRVGFLENARYPDGTPVAAVAAYNDFGTRRIPPRPFFRNMVAKKSPEWPDQIERLLKANDMDAQKTLGQMGAKIAGDLRQSIVDTNEPPNAPSTIRGKGGASKPLVDTGHMLNSIDFEII
jgi:hypothetical protein